MFSKLLGNEHIKSALLRLFNAGRVPNAMLFAGPDGVGKHLFAVELAKAFFCRSVGETVPCGVCSACTRTGQIEMPKADDRDAFKRLIFSGHRDLGLITAHNRLIAVDAIRDLEREAYFRPVEANARFFIIDEADKMNSASANALLKTLEEPASTSHLILTTSRPDSLLQTIRSRTQIFRFGPVPTEDIEMHLTEACGFSVEDARLAASLSAGSIGAASGIDVGRLREKRELFISAIEAAGGDHRVITLMQTAEKLSDPKNKEDFESDLDLLVLLIRDVWLLSLGGDENRLANRDLAGRLRPVADRVPPKRLAGWMNAVEDLRGRLSVNINKKIASDALFVGMAA